AWLSTVCCVRCGVPFLNLTSSTPSTYLGIGETTRTGVSPAAPTLPEPEPEPPGAAEADDDPPLGGGELLSLVQPSSGSIGGTTPQSPSSGAPGAWAAGDAAGPTRPRSAADR